MDVAAGHPERGEVGADGLFVRAVEQAVDLAVVIVVQLDLAHAELLRAAGLLAEGTSTLDRIRAHL
jgi:hypothetical protein